MVNARAVDKLILSPVFYLGIVRLDWKIDQLMFVPLAAAAQLPCYALATANECFNCSNDTGVFLKISH